MGSVRFNAVLVRRGPAAAGERPMAQPPLQEAGGRPKST
jgi:hypothetical protein